MKMRMYTSGSGQRYAIVEGMRGCTAFRKIPYKELMDHYRDRLNELCMDDSCAYWLPIYRAWTRDEAVEFLRRIGLDCRKREDALHKPGEGCFSITDQQNRVMECITGNRVAATLGMLYPKRAW